MRIYAPPTYALGDDNGDYILLPGARLYSSSSGQPYESLGGDRTDSGGRFGFGLRGEDEMIRKVANAQADTAMADPDQERAARREIARMRAALRGWLKFRRINDEVASGKRKARIPRSLAARAVERDRDWEGEQKLADDLYLLLSEAMPDTQLPSPNVKADPNAAVKLAQIAIAGQSPAASGPQAQGIWPIVVLTVGAVILFATTSYISNRAEVEKEKERMMCVRSGACTDYGFWLKMASVAVLGWFAWDKLGVRERVAELQKGGRRRRRRR